MLMCMFPIISAGLKKKKFGSNTLFFDGDKVAIIENQHSTTYMVYANEEQTQFKLVNEIHNQSKSYLSEVIPEKTFIIPEISKRIDTSFIKHVDIKRFPYPNIIYQIVSYGILSEDNFKGCFISNSAINIAVQNCYGKTFSIECKTAKDTVCGSGKYNVSINEAYLFKPIFTWLSNGKIYL